MKNAMRTTLAEIDLKLRKAAKLLDAAAHDVRDAAFNPRINIAKIGAALVAVFEVQHQIYRRVPTLAPKRILHDLGIARGRSRKAAKTKRTKARRPRVAPSAGK